MNVSRRHFFFGSLALPALAADQAGGRKAQCPADPGGRSAFVDPGLLRQPRSAHAEYRPPGADRHPVSEPLRLRPGGRPGARRAVHRAHHHATQGRGRGHAGEAAGRHRVRVRHHHGRCGGRAIPRRADGRQAILPDRRLHPLRHPAGSRRLRAGPARHLRAGSPGQQRGARQGDAGREPVGQSAAGSGRHYRARCRSRRPGGQTHAEEAARQHAGHLHLALRIAVRTAWTCGPRAMPPTRSTCTRK